MLWGCETVSPMANLQMLRFMRILFIFLSVAALVPCSVFGQYKVRMMGTAASFPLVTAEGAASVSCDHEDFEVVKKASALLADDIFRVTGCRSKVSIRGVTTKFCVIAGTIGHSPAIDKLAKRGLIDINPIKGTWERFVIKTVDEPLCGVKKALVIAGSDRRATAYGLLSLSEAIGVSPFYWWADVPVKTSRQLYIDAVDYVSKAPSVKYRGIFINDEGWGFGPWAANNYEKELGAIGPRTYSKVCELLLRLKANMLAPAMHPSSAAFNKWAKNKLVADSFGIIMTSSHCEPLLFNNVTEWDKETMGEWSYIANKAGINRQLERRVKENSPYENIYTIAMRGIHDAGLVGVPKDKEVSLVEEVIADQRAILSKRIKRPVEEIPQIFVPYKEVLDIYERGLRLPDDITLVWPDDNFGYIKRLSNSNEQRRSGGSGVYYHISYLGEPHDYLWLNTTPPALMYEEMSKAYATGASRYWLLNVGDIKPGELGMKTFLDMAWDFDSFSYSNINRHQVDMLVSIFGKNYESDIADILNSYYVLGFQHKPEHMGWGYEWNRKGHDEERMTDTEFSFENYNEAESRMEEYDRIARKAETLWKSLPEAYQPAFFELLAYPVKGAALINKQMLLAQKNRWYARQRRAETNLLQRQVKACHDSIAAYTRMFNALLGGKWSQMMSLAPGWTATYQNLPPTDSIAVPVRGELRLWLPGQDYADASASNVLPCANPYFGDGGYMEIYNTGKTPLQWRAECREPWLRLSGYGGIVNGQSRVNVSVDWEKAPSGRSHGLVTMILNGKKEYVIVPVWKPVPDEADGLYVEANGCVSIDPALFHRKTERAGVKVSVIDALGYGGRCVQLGDVTQESFNLYDPDSATSVEYDFVSSSSGAVMVYVYALPTFPLDSKHGTSIGVVIDEGLVKSVSNSAEEYSGEWRENVYRNSSLGAISLNVDKPGRHTLRLICADPGVVVQKVALDFGGMKRSWLGPPSTFVP